MQRTAFRACQIAVAAIWLVSPCPRQAEPRTRNTDWFHKAGYGVFVHYLATLQNNRATINSPSRETSWEECVPSTAPTRR